nr:hypothetical protein [uncultured Porphyromonas sp.]DAT51005.1 MAG TPA: hypothetical protein [Caudoviricetes sp.]
MDRHNHDLFPVFTYDQRVYLWVLWILLLQVLYTGSLLFVLLRIY